MFTQKIAELDETRNLNTSPWTILGFKGDQFDYPFMIFCDSGGVTTVSNLAIFPNGDDTGDNSEFSEMYGTGTTKSSYTDTTVNGCLFSSFEKQNSNRNSLAVGVISGDSAQDRFFKILHSTGDAKISLLHQIWNNNADELTSLEFKGGTNGSFKWHIVVWEVPKLGNSDNWELINKLSWSASSAEQAFTGLEGDTDLFYKLLWDSQDASLDVEINNDGSSSYKEERARNTGAAFTSTSGTKTAIELKRSSMLIINAESGDKRTAFSFSGDDGSNRHEVLADWYTDTATEITSLYCTPSGSTTAEAKLYKAKYPQGCVPDMFGLPFKKVKSFSVNTEDFTSGQSFDNLDGDNVILYRLEFKGLKDGFDIDVRTNGDSGASDYAWQYLNGRSTVESAGSDTADSSLRFIRGRDTAEQAYGVMYIYPQSGEYRPCLSYSMNDEDEIELASGWRLDTATEITSILVFASATTTLNGIFTLSEIRL